MMTPALKLLRWLLAGVGERGELFKKRAICLASIQNDSGLPPLPLIMLGPPGDDGTDRSDR
jgi:hypothetical protein